jgi:hypothetical protein
MRRGRVARWVPEDPGLARGGLEMTKQQADCGRLAGAVRSQEAKNVTRFHGQVQLIQRESPAKTLGESNGLGSVERRQRRHLGSFEVGRICPPTRLPGTPLSVYPPSDTASCSPVRLGRTAMRNARPIPNAACAGQNLLRAPGSQRSFPDGSPRLPRSRRYLISTAPVVG